MITSYKEMSVGIFTRYIDIVKKYTREDGAQLTQEEALAMQVEAIALLSGRSQEEVLDLPISEYGKAVRQLSFLDDDVPEASGHLRKSYKVGAFECIPIRRIEDMTTAQYIDFQESAKAGQDRIVDILSTLIVPKGMTYGKCDMDALHEAIMSDLPITDANDLLAFFLMRYVSLIRSSLTYSEWMVKRMGDQAKKAEIMRTIRETRELLERSGDGFRVLMLYPKRTDAHGMLSGKCPSCSSSTSSPTGKTGMKMKRRGRRDGE